MRQGGGGLFYDVPLLLQAGIFFAQALQLLLEMFVLDLLLLALHPVICLNSSVERIFIDLEVTGRLGNGLLGLDGQVHRTFFEFGGIFFIVD
jgi:hypothetical protein